MASNSAHSLGLVTCSAYPSSMAKSSFRRQTPKVGARCVNRARRDLCGGCSVRSIPTVILTSITRWSDLEQAELRAGKIIEVEDFPEARKPAYKITVNFGPGTGVKRSRAQAPPSTPMRS